MSYRSKAVDFVQFLATPTGLEPVTLCLEGRCSIQLSYGATDWKIRRKLPENKRFRKISR